MASTILNDILDQCLSLEKCAIRFYQRLSKTTEDDTLKIFWEDMAKQEGDHVRYWKELIILAEQGKIRNIFDDPKTILKDLKSIQSQVDAILHSDTDFSDCTTAFLIAYRLEFYMMHPAFEALFHLMKNETGDKSPEDNYEHHIRGLLGAMKQCETPGPEFEIISELMERLWTSNRQLALQLADIRTLRGFIPICMHCKNVRDDKGFWEKVEHYIESHADVQFSHGICPDCMKKYYSDYVDPKDKET